ncbi:MAG: GntR family transcriptional regulator [Oscillospiraceae bacterium]|nr:GntR family transcriptional regulator [Oscillospiraceae bacterium]
MTAWENFATVFDDKTPIYSQIITMLSRSFARGQIQTGERIPSIRDMAINLKVNANTVGRVYQEMERMGLILSKRGTGYFFTEDSGMKEKVRGSMAEESINRFLDEMQDLGFKDKQILDEIKKQTERRNYNGDSDRHGD